MRFKSVRQRKAVMARIREISTDRLAAINTAKGKHWFKPDTKRFFGSKIPEKAYVKGQNAYFISSEMRGFSPSEGRAYTIRKMNLKTGSVDDVGGFLKYPSGARARKDLNIILKSPMKVRRKSPRLSRRKTKEAFTILR